jgi:hypothetical protein
MPLVSGVCRTASAPMLSHGGSRLNASKPEANPKTSCPKKQNLFLFFCAFQTFVNENPWRFFFRYWLVLEMSPTRFRASEKAEEQKKERARAKTDVSGAREKSLQIESPFNRMLPSGGLDGAKYMKNSRVFFFFLKPKLFVCVHFFLILFGEERRNSFWTPHPKQNSSAEGNSNAGMERQRAQKNMNKHNNNQNTSPYKR